LSENVDRIVNVTNFIDLSLEQLKYLLCLEDRNIEVEENDYEAVIGWIRHDVINREKQVEKSLRFVKFSEMLFEISNSYCRERKYDSKFFTITRSVLTAIRNPKTMQSSTDTNVFVDVIEICPVLPLQDFLAVDNTTVWEVKSTGLKETFA